MENEIENAFCSHSRWHGDVVLAISTDKAALSIRRLASWLHCLAFWSSINSLLNSLAHFRYCHITSQGCWERFSYLTGP